MPLLGLKTRSLILTSLRLSPHFRGHPECLAGGFERCQRVPLAQGQGGVGAVPPSTSGAGTSVVWLFYAEVMAKNFKGINWIFSKLVAFCLKKYCDSKSENEQFNFKKKKIKNEDLERIAKNNTFPPSPPRALSCNSLRPCQGRAGGLLARGWKQRDPEEFHNRAILAWRYFTLACPGDREGGLQVWLGLEKTHDNLMVPQLQPNIHPHVF